jgi:hypothetical protein
MIGKGTLPVLAFAVISATFLPLAAQGKSKMKPKPGEQISPAPAPTPQIQPLPSPTQPVAEPPKITYFQINRGQETTTSRTVTLSFMAERASHYRASERSDFYGAQWKYITTPPTYTLSSGDGRKTVYLQVKGAVKVSTVARDYITLSVPPPPPTSSAGDRKRFVIDADDAYWDASYKGFTFPIIKNDPLSTCSRNPHYHQLLLQTGTTSSGNPLDAANQTHGSKCDFILFGDKQLNVGWTFQGYFDGNNCGGDNRGFRVIEKPAVGGRNIRFKIHLWNNPFNWCQYFFQKIVLEGPADAQPSDAFKQQY